MPIAVPHISLWGGRPKVRLRAPPGVAGSPSRRDSEHLPGPTAVRTTCTASSDAQGQGTRLIQGAASTSEVRHAGPGRSRPRCARKAGPRVVGRQQILARRYARAPTTARTSAVTSPTSPPWSCTAAPLRTEALNPPVARVQGAPGSGASGCGRLGPCAFRRDGALRRLADEDVRCVGHRRWRHRSRRGPRRRQSPAAWTHRAGREEPDFASGTSSKSSKMVHGGLRYLQQREFRLVYENLAPSASGSWTTHSISSRPCRFLIPALRSATGSSPRRWRARIPAALAWLYDLTGGWRVGERHQEVSKDQALAHLPTLNTDRLVAGFLYFDARRRTMRASPSRWPARRPSRPGAAIANYLPVVSPNGHEQLGTTRGGARPARRRPIRARSTSARPRGRREHDRRVGRRHPPSTRGPIPTPFARPRASTVTVPASRLPCDIACRDSSAQDKRSIFVVSWPGTDLVYLGTTDTAYTGPLKRLPARPRTSTTCSKRPTTSRRHAS